MMIFVLQPNFYFHFSFYREFSIFFDIMKISILSLSILLSSVWSYQPTPYIKPGKGHYNELTNICNLNGNWIDTNGNIANIAQDNNNNLLVTSLTQGTGWTNATGYLVNQTFLWVNFGTNNNLTASVSPWCTDLMFSNNQHWSKTQPIANITKLHIVFMTHLDIGFTKLAADVCEEYFFNYFPASINTAETLRQRNSNASYSATSHPWLVMEYLDGATGCSRTPRNSSMIQLMETAIQNNDVRWHGKPMNNFVELEDNEWFLTSLSLSNRLNTKYGKNWGSYTCKSTDVPGLSKSTIPLFVQAGKGAVHIGYNSACRMAEIPMAFNWVHTETSTSILTFVNNNYGSLILVPGSSDALIFYYSVDNSSPPTADDVETWWAAQQKNFPNAKLVLSSLDEFALAIAPLTETLPQVTGEIGQSWSYTTAGDPLKVAGFRAARRLRNNAVQAGWLDAGDTNLFNYERRLWVGGPEHNWGLSFGQYVPGARSPNGNWSNALFHAIRSQPDYEYFDMGNIEKRNYTIPLPPIEPVSPGYQQYVTELADIASNLYPTSLPDLAPYQEVNVNQIFSNCGRFQSVQFSPQDGSIISLIDNYTGYQWVNLYNTSTGQPGTIGSFSYRTYTEWDFTRFNIEYNPNCGPPCGDFAKQGMDSANPINQTWFPTLVALYQNTNLPQGGCNFLSELNLDPTTVTYYGGMESIWLNITIDANPLLTLPSVMVELIWLNKTATRLAESSWLSFNVNTGTNSDVNLWKMDILGYPVSPYEVVNMGTRHVHAVWDGVSYDNRVNQGPYINLLTYDIGIVSPGDTDHLLWYDGYSQPDLRGGWHFNLHNNLFGTAAPQWYDSNAKYRFVLELQPPVTSA